MATTNFQSWESGVVAIDALADAATFTPAGPVRVVRIGVTGTTAYTHGSGAIIKADKNLSNGNGTYTRGDGDGGTLTVDSTFAAGKVNYAEPSPYELNPGDQLIFQVTQAASAGDGVVWVEYEHLPFQSGSSDPANDHLNNALKV